MDSFFKDHNPLEYRTYKYKNPTTQFFCPLCRTERSFLYSPRLTSKNWFYILAITLFSSVALFPFWGPKSLVSFFVAWAGMEWTIRALFKKEIPCPHCGFDASWYKRDVRVARTLVEDFWKGKNTTMNGTAKVDSVTPLNDQ